MQPNVPFTADDNETSIADALNRVAAEMRLLRTSIDGFRTDFQWAVQNSRMPSSANRTAANNVADSPFMLPVFEEGELVDLQIDGETVEGAVYRLDDATNSATVQLTLTGGLVQKSQDELLRVEPSELPKAPGVRSRQSDATSEAGTLF